MGNFWNGSSGCGGATVWRITAPNLGIAAMLNVTSADGWQVLTNGAEGRWLILTRETEHLPPRTKACAFGQWLTPGGPFLGAIRNFVLMDS